MAAYIILVLVLLLFAFFFAAMEVAFVSANKLRIELDKNRRSTTPQWLSVI